jgi:hypothetical protein
MTQLASLSNTSPVVSVAISSDGRVQIACHVPKTEAVKLLLNVVEELRLQAFREDARIVRVAPSP